MQCSKCNNQNQDGFKFCSKCGNPLNPVPPIVGYDNKINESKTDALPFWRKIPGFRTKTTSKMLFASVVYGFILLSIVIPKGDNPSKQTIATQSPAIGMYQQIDSLYKNKDYSKAKQVFIELSQKYPDTTETAKAKEMISNIDALIQQQQDEKTQEENKKVQEAAAKTARLDVALSNMRKTTDEVKNINWYHDKSTTQHENENDFFAYIGKNSERPWLRLKIQFADDDWLFIKKYIIKADDKTFTIETQFDEVKRDNNSMVWEWYDVQMDKNKYEIIKAVIASNKTILRCEGQQYYKDRTITAKEKEALQNVLDAYEALGGSLSFNS